MMISSCMCRFRASRFLRRLSLMWRGMCIRWPRSTRAISRMSSRRYSGLARSLCRAPMSVRLIMSWMWFPSLLSSISKQPSPTLFIPRKRTSRWPMRATWWYPKEPILNGFSIPRMSILFTLWLRIIRWLLCPMRTVAHRWHTRLCTRLTILSMPITSSTFRPIRWSMLSLPFPMPFLLSQLSSCAILLCSTACSFKARSRMITVSADLCSRWWKPTRKILTARTSLRSI